MGVIAAGVVVVGVRLAAETSVGRARVRGRLGCCRVDTAP